VLWVAFLTVLGGGVDARSLYLRAIRLPTYAPWREQTLEAAERLRLLKEAARLEPKNALFRMALCELLPPGDPGRREELWRLSRLPDPSVRRWAIWNLASDALLSGRVGEALSLLARSPPDPRNALLDLEEAFCLLRLGRVGEAVGRLEEAARKGALWVYKSPARAEMEEAHPHFVGAPLGVLSLPSRLREILPLPLSVVGAEGWDRALKAALTVLRLSLLLARSEGVPGGPELASQLASEAIERLSRVAPNSEEGKRLREEALKVRGALAGVRPPPKPKWAEKALLLFTFGMGRGRMAALTRWASWVSVTALPSLILGLILSWPLGMGVKSRRRRRALRGAILGLSLALGTGTGIRAAWNPALRWAERKVSLYEREWGVKKGAAVSARIEEALREMSKRGEPGR